MAIPSEHFAGQYLSGQFARAHGNIDAAIHYLQQVHGDDPGNEHVVEQLLGMLLLQGQVDKAIELAKNTDKAGNDDSLSALLLVMDDIKHKRLDEAASSLDMASGNGPVQLWQPLIAAWLDLGRHQIDKPLQIEQFSADVGRAAPLVHYHLALINAQAGFADAAAQDFKNAIEDPRHPPERVMQPLLRFYAEHGKPQILAPIVKAYLVAHPESGNLDNTPLIATPQDGVAEVLYTMGGIMLGADISNDAVVYLQLALYVKPDFTAAAMALGDAYSELQQFARANDFYARVPPHDPHYVKTQLQIAVNEDRMGKLDEALARLDTIAAQTPARSAAALITRGDLLRMHSRYAAAVEAYSHAIERVPSLTMAYWPVLFARGSCYERLGNWALAEKDLQQALALSPHQPEVLNYLGYGWMEHGDHLAEARKMIEQAIKARPDNAEIIDSMGWALYLQGDYNGAEDYIEKAVELLPGDPTVNDHLGDVYWRLGRKNEARFQWSQSLNFQPDAKLAADLQRKLKEGLPPVAVADTASDAKPGSATP